MRIRALTTIRMICITIDFDEVVKRRKMIREYDSDRQQIPNEIITKLIKNAHRAPGAPDDIVAKRILNDSGFFDSKKVFYPPPLNSRDYFEYTVIATLNGKLQAVYWTDSSEDIPSGIKNLPFILAYVLGTGKVF